MDYYSYDSKEHEVKEKQEEEDDYIDMEVSSFTHFFSMSKVTTREFEFQMSSSNVQTESTTSPADELFYKGKLLPLHLPPRLQMVEKLLQDSPPPTHRNKLREFYGTPLGTHSATTPTAGTPFESCNISPVESCHVSRELNQEEYFRHFVSPDESKGFINDNNHKRSWTKKLKTKIRSLFGKSRSSDESSLAKNKEEGSILKVSEYLDKETKGTQNNPFEHIIFQGQNEAKEGKICHRRSFSGAVKHHSTTTKLSSASSSGSSSSSSSSSASLSASSNLNGVHDIQPLKRSSCANSEMESSLIQGAIAHCKKSHQSFQMRKTLSEIGFHSFSSSRFAAFDDETRSTGLCRG